MHRFFLKVRTKLKVFFSDLPILFLTFKDRRTPVATKLITGLTIVYLFSPVDLIPDFIPVLGVADDLLVVPLLVSLAIKTIPLVVLTDARVRWKRTKGWVLAFIVFCIVALAAYYGYTYFTSPSENDDSWQSLLPKGKSALEGFWFNTTLLS